MQEGPAIDKERSFFAAVETGDLSRIHALLEADPRLAEARNAAGLSGLVIAQYYGQYAVVEALRQRRTELDLFEASATGDTRRVRAILAMDPLQAHTYATDGFTPLGLAAFMGHEEAVDELLQADADVNARARNPMGVRPLHSALAHRDAQTAYRIAATLLEHSADPDVAQQGGWTPLHQACAQGRSEAAALLIRYGADPQRRSEDGRTPLERARENGHAGFEDILNIPSGGEPNFVPLETYRTYPAPEMQARSVQFLAEVRRRRTVRHFSDRPVPRAVIENCLRAAGTAPSGANRQPWHFVVVGEDGVKAKIRAAAEEEERAFYSGRAPQAWLDALAPLGTDEHKPFLETAPYLIAVFAQKYLLTAEGEKQKNYYVQESVGLATGLLITALHHAGLGTLTHTPSPMGFLNDILGRPEQERAFLLLVVGYPAPDAVVPKITKKSLRDYVTFVE